MAQAWICVVAVVGAGELESARVSAAVHHALMLRAALRVASRTGGYAVRAGPRSPSTPSRRAAAGQGGGGLPRARRSGRAQSLNTRRALQAPVQARLRRARRVPAAAAAAAAAADVFGGAGRRGGGGEDADPSLELGEFGRRLPCVCVCARARVCV